MCAITKKEFEDAYRKFPPSKCEMFHMKYLSIHGLQNNKIPVVMGVLALLFPFILEILFYFFGCANHFLMAVPNLFYISVLAVIGIYAIKITWKKNKRLEKIRKHLAISKSDYEYLINAHYYHRYPNLEKYIKYNSKNIQ